MPTSDRFMARALYWPHLCHLAPTSEDLEYADNKDGRDDLSYRHAEGRIWVGMGQKVADRLRLG